MKNPMKMKYFGWICLWLISRHHANGGRRYITRHRPLPPDLPTKFLCWPPGVCSNLTVTSNYDHFSIEISSNIKQLLTVPNFHNLLRLLEMVMNLHRDTGQVQDFGEEGGGTVLLSDLMGLVRSVFGG